MTGTIDQERQRLQQQLDEVNTRIVEQIKLRSEEYRQQLVQRIVELGDPDWIMSMLNPQVNHGASQEDSTRRS